MAFEDFFGGGSRGKKDGVQYIIGRVDKVVYGPVQSNGQSDPDYTNPSDIGSIRFVIFNSQQQGSLLAAGNPIARPIWSGLKRLPLQNEYVYIIPGPSPGLNDVKGAQDLYYLPPFSLWGSPHHDAFPSLDEYQDYQQIQQLYYNETLEGTATNIQTTKIEYPLGDGFFELANIKSLRPFTGDCLFEGRWGNSIRFGSTLLRNRNDNNWSLSNQEGDPITIIRNGQDPDNKTDNWYPTVEDINRDKSSIYLTAGQRIVIDDIQNNFKLDTFGVVLQRQVTVRKTTTPVPNSNDNLSPQLVDKLNADRGFPDSKPENE